MSKLEPLQALTALDNFSEETNGVAVSEVTDLAIVSIAISPVNDKAFAAALKKGFKTARPDVGQFTHAKTANTKVLGLQRDQLFILFDYEGDRAVEEVAAKINSSKQLAYLSDQSDSWVTLRVNGDNCLEALERICPIDLHPSAFPVGSVARTSMEHMAAIIIHESQGSYLLLSLRSFAESFLHAVTTSIKNIS